MLDALRANKRGIITWAIVAGIVVIFAINFGPGSFSRTADGGFSGGTAQYAARVNGETIGAMEYEKQLARMYEVYRAQSGGQLTRELAVQLGLPSQALDMLIERRVVVQEAKRRGLRIQDDEIRDEIAQNPGFFVNGKFDREAYRDIARQNFGSEARFEDAIRDDLLYRHMLAAVAQTVKVPEAEARAAWEASKDKASLRYVIFPRTALEAAVKPTDAEVKELAAKDPARVQAFYESNKARFEQKRRVKVRHVLARAEPGADDAAARKKIEDAKARVAKGEDFAAVVAALSEDENTKARGGDVGFVAEGLFDDAFAQAALALEKGQVSEPVRSSSGWHLLRADEVVPARTVTLEQAIPEIARELLVKERAARLGAERAEAALAAARKAKEPGKALAGFQGKLGDRTLAPEETGTFEAGGEIVPKLGLVKELLADVRAAKAGALLPRVYETAAGPVIAEVVSREQPDPAAWEQEKAAAIERLRTQKEYAVVQAWVKSLRDASKVAVNDGYLAQVLPGQR